MTESKSKFQAVIFDLDGTLLDTLKDLGDAMNRILERRGWPKHPDAAYKKFVGNGARKLIERAIPTDKRTPDIMEQCLAEFIDDYRGNWAVNTAPYPGVEDMLSALQKRSVVMSVLSNKIHDFTLKCVEKFLPYSFAIVLGERKGIARKPDPAGVYEILEKTRVDADKTLYVGDTAIDMQTGKGAGLVTVGVLWGFRDRAELEENGADMIVKKPAELLDIVFG